MRKTLNGEVDPTIIEQNIHFYDDYIGNRSSEEEKVVLDELGDPRLIVKTIIEKDRAAKQKNHYDYNKNYNYSDYKENEDNNQNNNRKSFFVTNFKWYQKLAIASIIILIILIIIIVSSILLKILFSFALPILLIVGIILLLKQR